ncbi:TlpA family protein disulfide reductase [Lewinella sp. IMCC34183]|uniref:TlpA family protein disulfide reductase n=1 Tax=Lewinella sp. IMCC34183 TaxID=2248762 RepID=UPI0013003A8E|nr:thioredoxin family protein [Lewinella sp. IMCC34183]
MQYTLIMLAFLVSCPLFAQEYGPRAEVRPLIISGTVTLPDSLLAGSTVGLAFRPWITNTHEEQQATILDDGSFVFTTEENTIREYTLIVGRYWLPFLARPGETTALQVVEDGGKPRLRAEAGTFAAQGIAVASLLDNYDTFRGLGYPQPGENPGPFLRAVAPREALLTYRLDSLRQADRITDKHVLEWGSQYIAYRLKHDVNLLPLMLYGPGTAERDSASAIERFPDRPPRLEEGEVYSNAYLDYVADEQLKLSLQTKGRSATVPKSERYAYVFQLRDSILATTPHALTRAYWQSLNLESYLQRARAGDVVVTVGEAFLPVLDYPLLARPLADRLRLLTDPPTAVVREQEVFALPDSSSSLFASLLERHAGKVLIIDLWATWCGPCKVQFRDVYPNLTQKYSKEEVAFVFASIDDSEAIWADYISQLPFQAEHLLLNNVQREVLGREYEVTGYPYHLVFTPDGRLSFSGHLFEPEAFAEAITTAREK